MVGERYMSMGHYDKARDVFRAASRRASATEDMIDQRVEFRLERHAPHQKQGGQDHPSSPHRFLPLSNLPRARSLGREGRPLGQVIVIRRVAPPRRLAGQPQGLGMPVAVRETEQDRGDVGQRPAPRAVVDRSTAWRRL